MILRSDICGGNLIVDRMEGHTAYVRQDTGDTKEWWFHWRFRAEELREGETWTFVFTDGDVVGPMGPAVRTQEIGWRFLHDFAAPGNTFSFAVPEGATWAEFAFSIPYDPEDFERFAAAHAGLPCVTREKLCLTPKGREVPMLRVSKGNTHGRMILTARHHACETTGNYLLEGMLSYLLERGDFLTYPLLRRYELCVVPFVDLDGVVEGHQGKFSVPHDHYEDYTEAPLYPSVAAIQSLGHGVRDLMAVDCHAPGRWGGRHDHAFISRPNIHVQPSLQVGRILHELCLDANPADTLLYEMIYDKRVETDWQGRYRTDEELGRILQRSGTDFAEYFSWQRAHTVVFETPYFGVKNNRASQESMRNLGRLAARALEIYIQQL